MQGIQLTIRRSNKLATNERRARDTHILGDRLELDLLLVVAAFVGHEAGWPWVSASLLDAQLATWTGRYLERLARL